MKKFKQATLESNRLKLRWLEESDVNEIFQIFSNKEAMLYWSTPPMQNHQEAEELVKKTKEDYVSGCALRFALECKKTAQLLGTCSLFSFHRTSRRAEVGYILGREHWGQGYMNEALNTLLEYAFNVLNLNRLEADIDPANKASSASLLRLGFSKEGLLRKRWIVNDQITDSELYGLLSDEWKS